MGIIRTVLGDIDASELGYCHAHEHIWIDGEIDDYSASLDELCRFKSAGGCSIVDAQPVNAGGNIERLKALSAASGVHVIATNGFHLDKYYPSGEIPEIKTQRDTGIMKCALDTLAKKDRYKAAMDQAVGIAREEGLALLVHVEKDARVEALLEYLAIRDIPMHRVIFCHMDRACDDMDIHAAAFNAGCYLEYDTVGRYKYHGDEKECAIISKGVSLGFEDKILLGLDTTKTRLAAYGGTPGLTFIREHFEGCMIENGLKAEIIKKFMEINPGKALSIE